MQKRHKVAIYHNILWPKYKGAVFSATYRLSEGSSLDISFVQIAETEAERTALGGVDLSYHNYPYRLIFQGSYSAVSTLRRTLALLIDLLKNPTDAVVLPGFHRIEYWAMLLTCMIVRRRRLVFCDSTLRDRPRFGWRQYAKRLFFSRCDGFLAYGQRSKEFLISYGAPSEKISFRCQAAAVPHGFDRASVLRKYDSVIRGGLDYPEFLFLGRFSQEKGLFDLLAAFKLFLRRNSKSVLHIVGNGPLKAQLEERVAAEDMQASVRFLGAKGFEDIEDLFVSSTALVLPSHSEAWGLVVNEALSYGCPVVVSNACGCAPELVIDGITGYSFEAGNIEELCDAMGRAVAFSQDRKAVAQRCMDIVSTYSPESAGAEILRRCVDVFREGV